ncbi:recombinase family protein [Parasedimentitalea psychrophila]|uniref:Recombinase family protein n=1 Tax=Parasedimentitalea psychrophila TaxID=2997337 RepID=A0A9Y2P7H8_9RHOB|nr:recombinase family protein [Parasedimentitalea psychrophila]WIY25830.1 recombinase family protein [Parasedimentitalea psychrophila]
MRCAIYTRKSSEHGLDQDFNSLDAQYEACTAYIASQRQEGWKLLTERYDDGRISGGTLERPALQRLLASIDAGHIDMVVVYKIDRLTRSLPDFVRMVDRLDAAGCSFVSVTQAFNTSSSMGRLTLNMLLSFAQFEREVTSERIRDKIAASKKKGLWMGGVPPIGYDPHPDPMTRELVPNEGEAETVRQLFDLYETLGCLAGVAREAARLGLRSKNHVFSTGREQGGNAFKRGQIYSLLRNPVYLGKICHKDKIWPGTHPAIVEKDQWDRVQEKLQAASARRRGQVPAKNRAGNQAGAACLTGLFRDETSDLLTPTHTQRHGRRLRYYISNRLISGGTDPSGWRLPALAFEDSVAKVISDHLAEQAKRHRILAHTEMAPSVSASSKATDFVARIKKAGITVVAPMITSGEIARGRIWINLDHISLAEALNLPPSALNSDFFAISALFTCRRRGVEMKIIAGETEPAPDAAMIRALRNAHLWAADLRSGTPLARIAEARGVSKSYVARVLPLACLSPRIQTAILEGSQPVNVNLETLVRSRLPLDWNEQERKLGIRV